ncbi:DNA methyltransferase [Enterovibrio sp. 27052020O]|uniref:DNA methyltransferase n=1 Tax=Enterovibrio sp. 27052020O TaxID=3241166 RepID=UPI00388F87FF
MNQESLFGTEGEKKLPGPVECLGMIFESDEARRAHFNEQLREKLKDPEFRSIEGFPIGTDEAILELSDPPYYTACPNPWLNEFIEFWELEKESNKEGIRKEPFAADVSEGKSDPIYNSHPYHTKVPPKAIQHYVEHYTSPGEIILDFTSGTGMTGRAVQQTSVNDTDTPNRKAILCDLSPIATWISYGINNLFNKSQADSLFNFFEGLLEKLDSHYVIEYKSQKRKLLYLVWSDIFICPSCEEEYVFWDLAINQDSGTINDTYFCNHCSSKISKSKSSVSTTAEFDFALGEVSHVGKKAPVIAVFQNGSRNERHLLSTEDREYFSKLNYPEISDVPRERIDKDFDIWFDRDYRKYGIYSIDKFFTNRALCILSEYKETLKGMGYPFYHFGMWMLTAVIRDCSLMTGLDIKKYFHGGGGPFSGGVKGTYFIPSLAVEKNVVFALRNRVKTISKAFLENAKPVDNSIITTQSASDLSRIQSSSIDYIFVDPPFGSNFIYSELNLISECWLGVKTHDDKEAVIHRRRKQSKTNSDYQSLMKDCFSQAYRLLKPGKWITVEFSNTKAAIWNSLQSSLSDAGFIVASVSALDKKQKSFKAVTTTTAVKQDLVISAYKPDVDFERKFDKGNCCEESAWEFVENHLNYLSVVRFSDGELTFIPERDPRILFDQVISYYVRNNLKVPLSSQQFQFGLTERFVSRDGMVFSPEQIIEYDKARSTSHSVKQYSIFVDDEASAIEWMRQELGSKPKTYSEIHPLFLNELSGWKKNELELELSTLLDQNFLKYDGKDDVPSQIHTYLSTNFKDMRGLDKSDPKLVAKAKDRWYVPDPNKAADLEKVRLRALLKEFESYKAEKKKIKQPRAEALRAGFNSAWESQDFQTILDISAKIPPAVLQEDEKLLMFYDNALTLTTTEDDEW